MSVAVDELDADHKAALHIMRWLCTHILGRDQAAASAVVQSLIDHDHQHFVREERMLKECGFPNLAGHSNGHRRAEALLAVLQASIAAADWPRAERLFEDACTNFVSLIADDIGYKWFLIDRGILPRFTGTRVTGWEPRKPAGERLVAAMIT